MTTDSIHILFARISVITIVLPLAVAIWKYRYANNVMRLFSQFIMITACAESAGLYMAGHGINNLWLLHFYTIVEFSAFMAFYYMIFPQKRVKQLFKAAIVVFAMADLAYIIAIADLATFNTLFRTIESFTLTIAGIFYFYHALSNDKFQEPLEKMPVFWINSGILLYFMGNVFLFMLFNIFLGVSPSQNTSMWTIHAVLNVVANVLFTKGLLCSKANLD